MLAVPATAERALTTSDVIDTGRWARLARTRSVSRCLTELSAASAPLAQVGPRYEAEQEQADRGLHGSRGGEQAHDDAQGADERDDIAPNL